MAVDVTPSRPESEQLINQAIIKKAKADGMENEIKIDDNGNLQNRDELLQEFIAKLSTQKSAAAQSNALYSQVAVPKAALMAELALNESALMSELAVELEIAEFEADLRAELALNSLAPVKLVAATKTATNSELFMYLGALILLLTLMIRRRLLV